MEQLSTEVYDLIICGGGMSGACCAIAAARQGLKCLLIEKDGCLGGTSTAVGVMQLLGGRRFDTEQDRMIRVIGGLFDEITDELIAEGSAIDPDTVAVHEYNPYGWYPRMAAGIPCDLDRLKYLLERKCIEAGVSLQYYTTVIGAEVQNGTVRKVITHEKGGTHEYFAKLFADCSGDGDLAALCGCPMLKGRKEDGAMCPATTVFYVDGVDAKEYVSYQNAHQSPKLVEIIKELKQSGKWPYNFDIFIAIETPKKGLFMINTIRQIDVDGTNAASMTKAIIEGREMSYQLTDIMREYFPGFKNAQIVRIFDQIGIRESRRIDARQMITLQNALDGKHYDDCVATTTYNFDLPDPKRPSFDPMMGDVTKPNATRKHVRIEIPYGALLPKGVDNLIVAGRCLGADREVMGACRVIGPCAGMGQAIGLAAALSLETGKFTQVPTEKLREMLINQGIINL